MPRQPLLTFIRQNPGGNFDVGTHAIQMRPELELVIAHCLMAWPPTEAEMALLLAHLLGVDQSEAALNVYHSLRRSSSQREAISEAARVTLNEIDRELLSAILNAHKSVEKERNALAHGHFGIYSKLTDGMVWMNTKTYVDFKAKMELQQQPFNNEIRDDLYSNVYVYRKPDLDSIFEDIKDIADTWYQFVNYLRETKHARRAELYLHICGRTHIRPELEKLRREKNRPVLP